MRGWVAPDKRAKASEAVVEGSVSASTVSQTPADGLNDRQRTFVDYYVAGIPAALSLVPLVDGDGNPRDVPPGDGYRSAVMAGYADASAANMAARNLLKPKVQTEIERRVKFGKGSALLAGVSALHKIVERGTDERAIVSAAVALLDRYGLAAPKGPLVDMRTVNIGGGEASSILADVMAKRAERLASAIPPAMPDTAPASAALPAPPVAPAQPEGFGHAEGGGSSAGVPPAVVSFTSPIPREPRKTPMAPAAEGLFD